MDQTWLVAWLVGTDPRAGDKDGKMGEDGGREGIRENGPAASEELGRRGCRGGGWLRWRGFIL